MTEGLPERVGPYRLQSRLGVGGMGEVFLALDPRGRAVAVKLLHSGGDEADRARLAREAETMRRVRSPYVAEVLGTGVAAGRSYIATRYVQGRPLDTVIREDGPLRGLRLTRLATGLADALAGVHAAGIVHRDLKPANVMIVGEDPVLIDFGIAYAAESTRVTETGAVIGTAGHVSPEVLRDERAGPAADVFAWAATVGYAATGRPVFGTGSMEQIFFRVLHGEPDLTGVPAALRGAVEAGLGKDPAVRPTATDLLAGLGQDVPAASPSPSPATGNAGNAERGAATEITAASRASSGTAPTLAWRSHAARRREERLRRIRSGRRRAGDGSRRGIWWLVAAALTFAAVMGAADDHISTAAKVWSHAGYVGMLALVFGVGWIGRSRRGVAGPPKRLAARISVAAGAGSGLAVLLAALVGSAVMTVVVAVAVVLGLAALVLS